MSGKSLKCEAGSPSICVIAGGYDTYHCDETGWWAKNQDHCPGLLTTGDTCTGEFICLYPSYWYCTCTGMGFPATCGDIRTTSTLLVPRDAGPDADPHPAILPCPENPQGVACDPKSYPRQACVRGNSTNLCSCVAGTWSCLAETCPAVIDLTTPCGTSDFNRLCLKDDDKICTCHPTTPGGSVYSFSCG